MRTILMIALAGMLSATGHAQTNCLGCMNGKATTDPYELYGAKPILQKQPVAEMTKGVVNNNLPVDGACTQRRTAGNIVVTECPGVFYDDAGHISYTRESSWAGYYPKPRDMNDVKNGAVAPQHTNLNNNKGTAPAGGNTCVNCGSKTW